MTKLTIREDETLDSLIRRFKKAVQKAEVIEDCRKHEYFLKKALKRREKSKRARIKARRK